MGPSVLVGGSGWAVGEAWSTRPSQGPCLALSAGGSDQLSSGFPWWWEDCLANLRMLPELGVSGVGCRVSAQSSAGGCERHPEGR